jgi:hypothetical protein
MDFEELFRARILDSPFGTLTKTELEYRLFAAMVDSGMLGDEPGVGDVATALTVSPTKAANLLYQHDLRTPSAADSARLARAIVVVRYDSAASEDATVTLAIENQFLRELLQARLKLAGVFVEFGRNRELFTVPLYRFVQALRVILPDSEYDEIVDRLAAEEDWAKGSLSRRLRERLSAAASAFSTNVRTVGTLADVLGALSR